MGQVSARGWLMTQCDMRHHVMVAAQQRREERAREQQINHEAGNRQTCARPADGPSGLNSRSDCASQGLSLLLAGEACLAGPPIHPPAQQRQQPCLGYVVDSKINAEGSEWL